MPCQWPPKKNTAFTLSFTLYKNDGTIVANPGTYTKKVSIDGGAVADIAANVTEEDTTYGQLSLVLSAAEMNGDWIWVYIKDNTAGTVPFTASLYTSAYTNDDLGSTLATIQADTDLLDDVSGGLADIHTDIAAVKSDTAAILEDTGTTIPATLAGLPASISAAVWNYLRSAMTTANSIGKALADWFAAVPAGSTPFTATDLSVCNNALLLLGNNAITAISDNTKAAKLCAQFYQQTVDSALRAYTWNAATTRSAALTATTAPSFGFTNAFSLPTDCLRVLTIEDDDTIKFRIENGVLLTDEGSVMISYIKRITMDEADSLLIEAISARLAATIAFSLTNSAGTADAMWKLYKDKLDEAHTIDAFEGSPSQMVGSDWVNSRG